jgi:DNA-binding winged helix-turn-helix (wHTH) protein/tetratricopeptide (TPR) repeat protein
MAAPSGYRLLDLAVDLRARRVTRDGQPLDVQGLNFSLLACLLAHEGAVVDFDRLMAEVWAPAVVNEETVTQRVKLLRQALGDDGRQPRYIRSVRGRGYQLCEPPVALGDDTTVPARVSPRSRWLLALAGGVLLAAGAGAWWWWRPIPSPVTAGPVQELLQRAGYYARIGQRDNNERAVALYREALQDAPHDRDGLLGLSRAYSARVCLYNFPPEWTDHAQRLAEEVVRARPRDAAGWAALAYAHDCRGELQAALDAYGKAVALDPDDDRSRASAAYLLQEQGKLVDALHANLDMHGDPRQVRFRDVQIARELELLGFGEAAEARFRHSFRLDPDNVFSNIAWPRHLFLQGRYGEAQAALDEAMQRHTPHVDLYLLQGELALLRGERAAAVAAFGQAAALRPQMVAPATLATVYGTRPPDPAWLQQRLATARAQIDAGLAYPSDRLQLAVLELARGDRTAAMAAVTAAVAAGYSDRAYLQTSPLWQPLRGLPAFAAAIDAIGRRVAAQRGQVLAADWCPPELQPARR